MRRRLIRWAAVAVGLPLTGLVLHRAADELERRRGASPATLRLHQAGHLADRAGQALRGRRRR